MFFLNIDKIDSEILNRLIQNSRLSYKQLAKKSKISTNTVFHRIHKMLKQGLIKNFSVELDYEKLGYELTTVIDIRFKGGRIPQMEAKISKIPNVFALYDTAGHFDAVVLARFKSRKELDNVIKKIQTFEFVDRTQTRLVLRTVKEEPLKI